MQEVNVKVAVRVRPLLPKEKISGEKRCVRVFPDTNQVVLGTDKGFTFDHVLSPQSTQGDVYQSVEPLVESLFEGYNATVFAYGQTGSGKTYTIGGGNLSSMTEQEQGIIPRAVKQMYDLMNSKPAVHFAVNVSYIEIYMEELCDLLDLDNKNLHVREDEKGNTVMWGVQEVPCQSMEDVMSCLESGTALRRTGSTQMNEHSSRSHSVFTIFIDQKWTDIDVMVNKPGDQLTSCSQSTDTEISHCISAKFHFVDLAGSERAHRIGNVGERFKESVHINTGLLALGNVISSLADPKKKAKHIPYRDSKITRILKDSLGGNAQTLMICCISPAASSFDESLNSLKYANRAKDIRNKPIVNRDSQSIRFEKMQTEIINLREELARERTRLFNMADNDAIIDTQNHVRDLQNNISRLQEESSQYQLLSEEAHKQLIKIQNRNILSESLSASLKNWLDLRGEVKRKMATISNISEKYSNEKMKELQTEIKTCREHLINDEEIFAEKAKEVNLLKEKLKEMVEAIKERDQCLENAENKIQQQQHQLLEQQIQLHDLNASHTITSDLDVLYAVRKPLTRPQTVPPKQNLSRPQPPSRQIHTSPALFSLEHVMQNFRARSQLMIVNLEDTDEVLQQSFDDNSITEDVVSNDNRDSADAFGNRNKGHVGRLRRTATFKKGPLHNNNNQDGTCCEVSVRHLNRDGMDGCKSRHSPNSSLTYVHVSDLHQQKVKANELKLKESNQRLNDLAVNIRLKEQFVRELLKKEKDAELLNEQYKNKIKEQEKEITRVQKELNETRQNLQELESRGHNEESEQRKMYLKVIQEAELKISALHKQQKETEKVANLMTQNEKKIEDLKLSVLKMKQQHDNLQKRLKEEYDQKLKLERGMQREMHRVKQLEQQNLQQQKILKRKNEEIAKAQRKLRGASLPRINMASQDSFDEKKRWLDLEIEKILEQRQRLDELQQELGKKEEIIVKKEAMLAEKSELEIKKLRSSQILNKNVLGLSEKLESVEKKLETKKLEISKGTEEEQDENNLMAEVDKLKEIQEKLKKQVIGMNEKLQDGVLLSNHEERRLIELEEAVEELNAAIEYKNKAIESQQMELRQSWFTTQNDTAILNFFSTLNPAETRSLLSRYFEKVITLRESDRKIIKEVNELEMKVEEQEQLLFESQNALQKATIEMDRKLTQQQQQYEQKIGVLMHQLTQSHSDTGSERQTSLNTKIYQLEKELYYYKKTSRDLKKKLRIFENKLANKSGDILEENSIFNKSISQSVASRDFAEKSQNEELNAAWCGPNKKQEIKNSNDDHLLYPLAASAKGSKSLQFQDSLED